MAKKINFKKIKGRGEWIFGGILVLVGVIMILGRITDITSLGSMFMFGLGVIFLVWGVLSGNGGLLVPGGILTGIGTGVVLNATALSHLESPADGGVFLLAFAGGWALITLFSLIHKPIQWWPLVPGAILALIGAGLLIGGPAIAVLEWAGKLWPLALIGVGAWMVWGRNKVKIP